VQIVISENFANPLKFGKKNQFIRHQHAAAVATIQTAARHWSCRKAREKAVTLSLTSRGMDFGTNMLDLMIEVREQAYKETRADSLAQALREVRAANRMDVIGGLGAGTAGLGAASLHGLENVGNVFSVKAASRSLKAA